jgi:hypothetical protein
MKVTSKPLAFALIIAFFAIVALGIYLQVLWADWAIQHIFNKDFHNLKIFVAMCIVEMLSPKALQGITMIVLILMTLYIFLTA